MKYICTLFGCKVLYKIYLHSLIYEYLKVHNSSLAFYTSLESFVEAKILLQRNLLRSLQDMLSYAAHFD